MPINSSDLSLVLSGGADNSSPDNSLGGIPSSTRINSGTLNNLFSDVVAEQASEGLEDYRCIYLFNDGESPVYEASLWIVSQVNDGSSIEMGILDLDEIQRITLSGAIVTGGSLTITYEGESFVSSYNSDLGLWALSMQTGLRSLTGDSGLLLEDVIVTAQNTGTIIIFDINFVGQNGKRNHDLISLTDNLIPNQVVANVTVIQHGSPVNTVAPNIDIETTTPSGVGFYAPSNQSPIILPNLLEGEGFPFWIRRTTPANAVAIASDGFKMRLRVKSLKPTSVVLPTPVP